MVTDKKKETSPTKKALSDRHRVMVEAALVVIVIAFSVLIAVKV